MQQKKKIEIYQAFYEAKEMGGTVTDVARKFGVTRQLIYYLVNRIEKGSPELVKKCMLGSRLGCLWQFKYKDRFEAIPEGRHAGSVRMLKKLVRDMAKDGFSGRRIAELLGKDRATIGFHLKGK